MNSLFLTVIKSVFFFPESKEIYNPQSCIFRIAHLSPGYTLTIPRLPTTFPEDFMHNIIIVFGLTNTSTNVNLTSNFF